MSIYQKNYNENYIFLVLKPGQRPVDCSSDSQLAEMQELYDNAVYTTKVLRDSFRPAYMHAQVSHFLSFDVGMPRYKHLISDTDSDTPFSVSAVTKY